MERQCTCVYRTMLLYLLVCTLHLYFQDYAADESKAKAKFLVDLGKAWNKLATADRCVKTYRTLIVVRTMMARMVSI